MMFTRLLDQIVESSKELGVLEDSRDKLTKSIKYHKENISELNGYLKRTKPLGKRYCPFGRNANDRNKVASNRVPNRRVQELRMVREMWRHERNVDAVQQRLDEQELQEVYERLATHEARLSRLRSRVEN